MQVLAAEIDAAVRSLLASEGKRATHADAAVVVGESGKAWRAYVRGDRDPRWAKVEGWIGGAWVSGVRVEVRAGAEGGSGLGEWTLSATADRHEESRSWGPTEEVARWHDRLESSVAFAINALARGGDRDEAMLLISNQVAWVPRAMSRAGAKASVDSTVARVEALVEAAGEATLVCAELPRRWGIDVWRVPDACVGLPVYDEAGSVVGEVISSPHRVVAIRIDADGVGSGLSMRTDDWCAKHGLDRSDLHPDPAIALMIIGEAAHAPEDG